MPRTVTASIGLTSVDAATLAAPVAGYRLVATDAIGAIVASDAPIDATSASLSLVAGTWTVYVVAVDAAGNELSPRITADPLEVTEPTQVFVNIPAALSLSVA